MAKRGDWLVLTVPVTSTVNIRNDDNNDLFLHHHLASNFVFIVWRAATLFIRALLVAVLSTPSCLFLLVDDDF